MKRRGFTLIELLVVVAVIGILVAMIVPVFGAAKESAHRKRCLANLKQIGIACALYQQRNSDLLPDRDGYDFLTALYQEGFLEDPRVYLCPSGVAMETGDGVFDPSDCSYGARNNSIHPLTSGQIARYGSRTALAGDSRQLHHQDVVEVLFADGHAEEIDIDEIGGYRQVLNELGQ